MDSLDLLLDCVRREREAQFAHFEALDSKAGILLAFAAVLAVGAFFPRRMPTLDVMNLREYLRVDEEFTMGIGAVTLALGIIVGGSSWLRATHRHPRPNRRRRFRRRRRTSPTRSSSPTSSGASTRTPRNAIAGIRPSAPS